MVAPTTTAASPPAMDRRVQRLVSGVAAAAATVSLLYLISHASTSCFPGATTLPLARFPRTSCDAASRRVVPPGRRLAKLRASARWRRRSVALASSSAFASLRGLRLLAGSSRALCLAAGAGHAVDALRAEGVGDVTGIDFVDFPPLVRRADPHHLPFSDGAFDLIFSDDPAGFSGALFPSRFAAEAERAVRSGGTIALAVDRHLDPSAVAVLFKRSRIVDQRDLTMDGSQSYAGVTSFTFNPEHTRQKEEGNQNARKQGRKTAYI
ncbi:uncharacterized protein [Oryza sativa Japonica Group]|uniref:uncharacterized protein isoform X1 n=1 Tax=Oryza sativa subsp. japonica TaxID=39947 RepID=UPI0007755633|nr:uncharacterized protein LOC4339233 isoform X1 [Oryza sativa Japonica Group]KAF2931498.1 hypothetical protein DAI22_05g203100 [Oryza sativa Japonica Group]